MHELLKINSEGTTIVMVTHDAKVAAKCERIVYIVDGNIKGEFKQEKMTSEDQIRDRVRAVNNWLMELGW